MERIAQAHGWRSERDPYPLLWYTYGCPKVLARWYRSVTYRQEIMEAFFSRWYYETKEHLVVEALASIGAACAVGLSALLVADQVSQRAMVSALIAGCCALVVITLGQGVRSAFKVRKCLRHVHERVQNRFHMLIEMYASYWTQASLNPHHSRGMFEQRDRNARDYAGQVDRFLGRYYPGQQMNLTRALVNVRVPAFDNTVARTEHIALCDAIIHRGMTYLETIRRSDQWPKPTPFNTVA